MVDKLFVCLDSDNGNVLWTIPHEIPSDLAPSSPVYEKGYVYFAGQKTGGTSIKLENDGGSYTKLWTNPTLDTKHGSIIIHEGNLYGSNTKGNWVCQDYATGEIKFADKIFDAMGSIIYSDGMLYCYSEKGTLGLVKMEDNLKIISSFEITQGTKEHWAHPVISDGRLYIRHGNVLMAFDIREIIAEV